MVHQDRLGGGCGSVAYSGTCIVAQYGLLLIVISVQYDRVHARGHLSKELDLAECTPVAVSIDQIKQRLEIVRVAGMSSCRLV
jgi:hypothetical protein